MEALKGEAVSAGIKEQFCDALSGLCNLYSEPRACALGYPAAPLRGFEPFVIRDEAEIATNAKLSTCGHKYGSVFPR